MNTYGTSTVPTHPTHTITDSTKLSCYDGCPRRYFFEYVLGWHPEGANIHLTFGQAVHIAKEVMRWLYLRDGGYKPEHVDKAMEIFEAEYRKHWSIEDDALNSPKNPECLRWALERYIEQYKLDRFTPLHTEVPGIIPLDANGEHWMHFRIDAIVIDHNENDMVVFMDDKTTTCEKIRKPGWAKGWRRTIQFILYNHVGRCLYGDRFWGVKVDGIGLSRKPRLKKDGDVYASDVDKQPELQRANVRFAGPVFEKQFQTVFSKLLALQSDFRILELDAPDGIMMRAFEERLSQYDCGWCPFLDFCDVRNNPLAHSLEPPVGFTREFWNPAEKQSDAKALICWDEHEGKMKLEQRKGTV